MKLSVSIEAWYEIFADHINSDGHVVWISSLDYQDYLFVSPALKHC